MPQIQLANGEMNTGIAVAESTLLCLGASEALKHVPTSPFPALRNLLLSCHRRQGEGKSMWRMRVSPELYKRAAAEQTEMRVYNYEAFALSGIPSCGTPVRWK